MTTALTAYLASAASTTISTANKLYTTSGTPTIVENDTLIGTQTGWIEMYSQGNASLQTPGGSIGSPSGHGFFLDTTVLEGQVFPNTTNGWSGAIRSGLKSTDTCTVTFTVRAYRYHSGTYTQIVSMTTSSQSFTTSSAVNISVPATTGTGGISFATGDKLYIDVWASITVAATLSTQKFRFDHLSTDTGGLTGDANANVVTPGYNIGTTTSTRTTPSTAALLQTNTRTIPDTSALLQTNTRTIPTTTALTFTSTRTIPGTTALLQTSTRIIPDTTALLKTSTRTIPGTTALLQTSTRTIPASAALVSARTIPATVALLQTNTRTIPNQVALLQTNTRTIPESVALLQTNTRTISTNTALLQTNTRTVPGIAALLQTNARTIPNQAALQLTSTRTIPNIAALLQTNTRTIPATTVLSTPGLVSGGFALFANGSGTAQFDSFRVTQYPDPALSLAPIVPRIGSTSISYNAMTPTNTTLGIDTSLDGVNWNDQTLQNGGMITGIFSQPDPTIDAFGTNTPANYISTFRTGGALAAWTYDIANSRLVVTGGTNALYLNSSINRADIDIFADLDQSDAGGLVFRYVDQNNFYYVLIGDTLASTGSKNTITLYKVAANVQTQLGTATISYTVGTPMDQYRVQFTRGTYRRVRVTMLKGVITVSVDGQQSITYTDNSPLGAGLAGLFNNGGAVGSRYYSLWITPIGDYVSGNPATDIVTADFVYTRQRLTTTDPSVSPQVLDVTTLGVTPDIEMGVIIPNITYNTSFLSANFDDAAKQSNFSWYARPDKSFVFRALSNVPAPWILQSGQPGLVGSVDIEINSDLELDVSNDLYRNRQTILGAQDTITPPPAIFVGNNNTKSFTLGYILAAAPIITLNGVAQKVGLKGTTGANYYYALNDAVIEQDATGIILQATDTLIVAYTGLFDIVVVVDDTAEQIARAAIEGGTGIVEAVEDHTGEGLLKNAAITLAAQLINRYAIAGRTLIFDTSRNGLLVGQTLTIFFPEHGITEGQFIITQIEIKLMKGLNDTQVYWYKVTASELPKQASWARLIADGLGLSG